MNAYWYSIQWGFKPRLNKVKASGGCHRFSEEIYRAKLDKIWAQIRQGAFDSQLITTLVLITSLLVQTCTRSPQDITFSKADSYLTRTSKIISVRI
ncbi:hypothetical protein [Siminovitchia terrae]|uniref:hypothetical protein n=1 Tax=Siminovitchia terrae TaxID=1914933 RepID=UPI001BB3CD9D|nr:hypothetical protein [Siminovitchia terrae]